jgi:hypothetical protein
MASNTQGKIAKHSCRVQVPFIPKSKLERLATNFESVSSDRPELAGQLKTVARSSHKIRPGDCHLFGATM